MFYEVIPTKVFRQDGGVLTYSSDLKLQSGQIVTIPLGRQSAVGIISRQVKKPNFPTKPITSLLYPEPIPQYLLKSIFWLSDYYLCPLPTVANLFLPSKVGKQKKSNDIVPHHSNTFTKNNHIPLNTNQLRALRQLDAISSTTKLLHGITGSGKTNVYLQLIANALKNNKSTILLVPEISLTSQLVQETQKIFGDQVILIHSQQTDAERYRTWQNLLQSNQPQIIIGPRSALLAPVHNLGLIIIDEAHETAYFQENAPRYSTLRLASFIAKTLQITCLQGTATPLIQDYYLAAKNQSIVELKEKAKQTAVEPDIHLIDLKDRQNFTTNRYFSDALIKKINENLTNHRQTLIFHNRRGSAPLTLCEHCGWQALCPICYLPLTLHADHYQLLCHTCGHQMAVPTSCPSCQHSNIIHKGFGTKLLENELKKLFKSARIARFDADNRKKESLGANYQAVKDGQIDIIIGTQTIARGLDLPNLTTVGVVQADAGLSLPDYAAEERTYHLLTQVIGRVGRGHQTEADIYLQTFQPEHPIIQAALRHDYQSFANHLLNIRQKAHFPPYIYLAKLTITYKTERTTLAKIKACQAILQKTKGLYVSTPTPAFHEQSPRGYTWQLILRSRSRQAITRSIANLPPNLGLHITLDPPSLL